MRDSFGKSRVLWSVILRSAGLEDRSVSCGGDWMKSWMRFVREKRTNGETADETKDKAND